jgi:hypothetical protein
VTVKEEFEEVRKLIEKAAGLLDKNDAARCRSTLEEAETKLTRAIEKMQVLAAYE